MANKKNDKIEVEGKVIEVLKQTNYNHLILKTVH